MVTSPMEMPPSPLISFSTIHTAQKIKFSINHFFSKCDQIRSFLRIWSHLRKKPLTENFNFCAVPPLHSLRIGQQEMLIQI